MQKITCNTLNPMRLFHQLQPTAPMQAIETSNFGELYELNSFVATYLANAGDLI